MSTPKDSEPALHYLHAELMHEIQHNTTFFDFIQQSSLDGLWYWDLENPDNEWMSPEFWTTLGYDPATQPHSPEAWQNLIHPEDKQAALQQFEAHCKDPQHPYDQHVRYRHANGSTVWIRCRGLALRDQTGKPIRMLGAHTNITALKETELALQSREQLWNQAIENSGIGIWSWDLEEQTVFYADEWKRMFGYDKQEPRSDMSTFISHIHPEDLPGCQDNLQRLCTGQAELCQKQHRMRNHEGEYIWVQTQAKATRKDANGNALHIVGTQIDISQLKRIELAQKETLRALEQRTLLLNASNEMSNTGWWSLDLETEAIYWSDITRNIHEVDEDFEPDLSTGLNFYKPGENRERIQADLEQAIANQSTLDGEYQMITARGREIWVRSIGKAEYDEAGKMIRMLGCFQDITARKKQELATQELLQELQRKTSLLETSNRLTQTGWWIYDFTTEKVEWPESIRKIYEVDSQVEPTPELIRSFYKDQATESRVLEHFNQASQDHSAIDITYEIRTAKGHLKWVHLVGQFELQNGIPVKLFGALQDITEQKLIEQRLIESKQKAEAANEAKDNFLANMSHEMRTPLNGITGFIELMMRTPLNTLQQSYIQAASYSTRHLTSVINGILDFSRLERGELTINEEKVLLSGWIHHLTDSVFVRMDEKKLEFLLQIASDLPGYIWTDPVRLSQVLENLLDNAIKFTEKGEVELSIRHFSDQDQDYIRFSVRDTGTGIAKDYQELIFEYFSQVDISSTRKFGGLGLGLTLAQRLLRLMGSELCFESDENEGSLFWFNLPVKVEGTYHQGSPPSLDHLKRVLVIDDNASNRKILHDMMRLDNIEVDTASNGFIGLQCLLDNTYDFAIVDYHMPLMDGLEVIQKIRQEIGLNAADLPILLLHSSADHHRIKPACQQFDVNYDEMKPITLDRLRHILGKPAALPSVKKMITPSPAAEDEKRQPPLHPLNILVVDDNNVNLVLAENLVKVVFPAAKITTAHNGEEAVMAYQRYLPDLILMDIQMPVQNGYEATKKIRALGAKLPIIALTAGTQEGEKERCLTAGMNDYLSKPVVFKHFKDMLLRHTANLRNVEQLPHVNKQILHQRTAQLNLNISQIQAEICQDLAVQLENIEQFLKTKDAFGWQNTAKRIRGSALYLCFERMAALATSLEAVDLQHLDQATYLLEALHTELQTVQRLTLV